ncbi:hypothetical protein G4228_004074 [Cervus hanglu yarkandensis]|nr:hypothetical protein G4228_004074 [Cervus hanglu yarkandensis]
MRVSLATLAFLLTLAILHSEANEGTCVELCSGDWDCGPEERCVSNGCGHVCASGKNIRSFPASSFHVEARQTVHVALMELPRSR